MFKKNVLFLALAAVVLSAGLAFCAGEISKEKVIAVASEAVIGKGVVLKDVNIIYDKDGQLWSQRIGAAAISNESNNHGILVKGFLKNYRIVYFDFKEPLKDFWVFVDKDSGEVLAVVQEK